MLTAEAAAYLDLATDFLKTKEFRRKFEAVHQSLGAHSGDLLFELAERTDAFLSEADAYLKSEVGMRQLVESADPSVIYCVGQRFHAVMFSLRLRSPKSEAPFEVDPDHPLTSALIRGWSLISAP